MILPFLALKDSLRPISPEGEAAVLSKQGQVVKVEILSPKQIHSRQQERYWFGVIVPMILACWLNEKEWAVEPDKETVHGRLVAAVFGMIETPLGPERVSSRHLTVEQYSQLIQAGKDYLWGKYKVTAPEPFEDSQ
jgi:hypothetical protein